MIDHQEKVEVHEEKQRDDEGIVFAGVTNGLIQMINMVHRVLNANTTIESFNNLTRAFQGTVNSDGWKALDTFVNTVGNSLAVFDVIGGGGSGGGGNGDDRSGDHLRRRARSRNSGRTAEDTLNEVQVSFNHMVGQLTLINRQLTCLISSASITNSRHVRKRNAENTSDCEFLQNNEIQDDY